MLYCYSYANKAHCCCCCSCLRKVKWRQTLNIVPLKERTWTRLSCDVDSETHVKINSLLGSLVTVLRSRLLIFAKMEESHPDFRQSCKSDDWKYNFIPGYEIEVEETTTN